MFCIQCGKRIEEGQTFCEACGAPVFGGKPDNKPENKPENTVRPAFTNRSIPLYGSPENTVHNVVESIPVETAPYKNYAIQPQADRAPVQNKAQGGGKKKRKHRKSFIIPSVIAAAVFAGVALFICLNFFVLRGAATREGLINKMMTAVFEDFSPENLEKCMHKDVVEINVRKANEEFGYGYDADDYIEKILAPNSEELKKYLEDMCGDELGNLKMSYEIKSEKRLSDDELKGIKSELEENGSGLEIKSAYYILINVSYDGQPASKFTLVAVSTGFRWYLYEFDI